MLFEMYNIHVIVRCCVQGAILIHEVYPDGAAAQDGRLRPGDQILEVSGQNFRSISHQKALNVLRQTPAKVRNRQSNMQQAGQHAAGETERNRLYCNFRCQKCYPDTVVSHQHFFIFT